MDLAQVKEVVLLATLACLVDRFSVQFGQGVCSLGLMKLQICEAGNYVTEITIFILVHLEVSTAP